MGGRVMFLVLVINLDEIVMEDKMEEFFKDWWIRGRSWFNGVFDDKFSFRVWIVVEVEREISCGRRNE